MPSLRIIRILRRQQALSEKWRRRGERVGLVPTMGALHEGHLSLVRASLASCDRTVVSIFVNPIQFGPKEDFTRYPRPAARDRRLLAALGVDALFAPPPRLMYPPGFATAVEVGGTLTAGLCSPRRPGHFRGVATVVAKLFNIVRPHEAFFGAKDYQQARVIGRMAADLDWDLRVRVLPTVRERDGLAMSSRNAYLTPDRRAAAIVLSRALVAGKALINVGSASKAAVLGAMRRILASERLARVEYLDIVDALTLAPVRSLRDRVLLAMAVRIGATRLIDNAVVRVPRKRSGARK